MKILKTIMVCLTLMVILNTVVDASTDMDTIKKTISIGEELSLSELIDENEDEEECVFFIEDETIISMEEDILIPIKEGITYVYKYYYDSLWDVFEITVTFEEGYYRIYKLGSNGEKQYLSVNDKYPDGSSLCLDNTKRMATGIEKYNQIWCIKQNTYDNVFDDNVYYTLAPASSVDTYITLDGEGTQIFLESYSNGTINDDVHNSYLLNEWYIESNQGGFNLLSNRFSYLKKN